MSTQYRGGSILDDDADLLVSPVNCVPGVMGAGLARAFAERWPSLKEEHRRLGNKGRLNPGHTHVVPLGDGRSCLFAPTKNHWKDPSRLGWVVFSLANLGETLDMFESGPLGVSSRCFRSVAIPALGCGLGGLRWATVGPLIESVAELYPDVDWRIYPPREGR